MRRSILLTCSFDSWTFRLVLSTVSCSAWKHCASGVHRRSKAHPGPRAKRQNAVVTWPSKGWRCCQLDQARWSTVSRLDFRHSVKSHVWHINLEPGALKVQSGSLLFFFFPSVGAADSRLQNWDVVSSRDWLCSVQAPSERETPRTVRWQQVWLPQNELLCLLPPPSSC